ncbi:MAG: hypothetical protein IPL52_11645 [Flavobacteriales bacterium]|nr:hypothetical protein [Flavobacteriales bacterium]
MITNGYDPADVPVPPEPVDEEYSLVHVGSMTATRDVPALWKLLAELCAGEASFGQRLKLRFIGAADQAVLSSIAAAGLASKVERIGSVDHAQAMRSMQRARVLLLSINDTANAKGVLTSKLFEYLSVGRPIIAVGPGDGDVGRVLRTPHLLLDRARTDWDAAAVRRMFDLPATGAVSTAYSRVALAERMGAVLGAG